MSTLKTNNIKSLDGTVTMTVQELRAMLDGGSIGVGQTWQDVTSSRVAGTAYTNTTGKPIQVVVTTDAGAFRDFKVDNIIIGSLGTSTTAIPVPIGIIVPVNSLYEVSGVGGLKAWVELR